MHERSSGQMHADEAPRLHGSGREKAVRGVHLLVITWPSASIAGGTAQKFYETKLKDKFDIAE
jgi:hypothetical protein